MEMVKIVYINHTWEALINHGFLTPKMSTVHCNAHLLVAIILCLYAVTLDSFSIKLSKNKQKQQSGNHKLAMQYDQSTS